MRVDRDRDETVFWEVVRRLRDRGDVRTVDEAYDELLRDLKAAFPTGFHPVGIRLGDVAQQIADGTPTE